MTDASARVQSNETSEGSAGFPSKPWIVPTVRQIAAGSAEDGAASDPDSGAFPS